MRSLHSFVLAAGTLLGLPLAAPGARAQDLPGGAFVQHIVSSYSRCQPTPVTTQPKELSVTVPIDTACDGYRFKGQLVYTVPPSIQATRNPSNPNEILLGTPFAATARYQMTVTTPGDPTLAPHDVYVNLTGNAGVEPYCGPVEDHRKDTGAGASVPFDKPNPCTYAKAFYDPQGGATAIVASFYAAGISSPASALGNQIVQVTTFYAFSSLTMDVRIATPGAKLKVKIRGASFGPSPTVEFLDAGGNVDPGLVVSNVTVLEGNRIEADLDVKDTVAKGRRTLRVKDGGAEQQLPNALNVVEVTGDLNQGAGQGTDPVRVANHPTVVRTYVASEVDVPDVTGRLYVFKNGTPVAGSPFSPGAAGNTPPYSRTLGVKTTYTNDDRFLLLDSLNFFFGRDLPGGVDLEAGDYEIYLALNPTDPTALPPSAAGASQAALKARRDHSLSKLPTTWKLRSTFPLWILFAYDPRMTPQELQNVTRGLPAAQRYMAAATPVDGSFFSFTPLAAPPAGTGLIPAKPWVADWGRATNNNLSNILISINNTLPGGRTFDRLVLLTDRTDLLAAGNGLANNDTFDTLIARTAIVSTLTHELFHTFVLGDTYCAGTCAGGAPSDSSCYWLMTNCRRADAVDNSLQTGNRVEPGAVRLAPASARAGFGATASVAASGSPRQLPTLTLQRVDLLGEVGFDDDRWPDLVEWRHVAGRLGLSSSRPAPAAAGVDALTVRGLLDSRDAVTLTRVLRTTLNPPETAAGSDLFVELLDSADAVASSKALALDFGRTSGGPTAGASFAANVPWVSSARKLRVRKGEKTLVTKALSPNPPAVQLTAPTAGQTVSGPTTIRWSASDPDGDALTYTVLYQAGSAPPLPLALEVTGTSFDWDPTSFPGSTSAKVLVTASDGTNERTAASGTFTVPKSGPKVWLATPADGSAVPVGTEVVLSGGGLDPEDGLLAGSALSYRSSVDGNIGTGASVSARLSQGTHTLTVRGTDQDGRAAEASVTLLVGAAGTVPLLETVTPGSGGTGTSVTLAGSGFGTSPSVLFGTAAATVTSSSATQVVAAVPAGLPPGPVPVTVRTGGATSQPVTFEVAVTRPLVGAIGPPSATPGTVVVVEGLALAASSGSSSVRFGTATALVTSASATRLVTSVPAGLAAGPVSVTVTTAQGTSDAFPFTVESGPAAGGLLLTSITPAAAAPGATVAIAGSGFASPASKNTVVFGSRSVAASALSGGTLTAQVPFDAPLGATHVSVVAYGFPSNPLAFTVGSAPAGPDISVTPASLDFGSVSLGQSRDLSVTVRNTGGGTLTVSALTVSGAGFSLVSPPVPFGVASGGQQAVTVRFAPSASGAASGSLAVSHNASGKPAVSVPLSGQGGTAGPSTSVFVPVVLSTSGANGSYFTSELTLTNRGTTETTVALDYTAAAGGGSGTAVDRLGAGRQKTVPDAIAYLRGLGLPIADTGARVGTLRVRFMGLSSPSAGAATVRTTTLVPPGKPATGRAGLAYAGLPASSLLTGTTFLCGLRQGGQDRSNVAVMNAGAPGEGDVTLRLTVFSGDPAAPASKVLETRTLSPGGFEQVSGVLEAEGLALSNGYVKVERIAGTAPYYAYGVVNDQATSDGSFVPPLVPESLAGKAGLILPVAVEASSYSTELVVTNLGTTARTVQLTYVASAIDTADHAATVALPIAAGEQRVIPSFVDFLRGLRLPGVGPAGSVFTGPVFVSSGSDVAGLFVGARTSAPGDGGRYGLFTTALPSGATATASAWLLGMLQDAENRTNLALVNTGESDGSASSFRIELFDGATGSLANVVDGVTVPARGFEQIGTILSEYAPSTPNGYARVTRASGSNPFLCYAVVNDGARPGERSGDGAFVPMEVDGSAPPPPGNLLRNGGAEEGEASPDGTTSVAVPGWTASEGFTVVRYGTPTFPDAAASAAVGGGQKLFYGGEQADVSYAEQTVSVASRAADIDAGRVTATVVAYAGTYDVSYDDAALVLVEFLGDAGLPLGILELGPSTTGDNTLERLEAEALVPSGTRSLLVSLVAFGEAGSALVYFDNVSLTLSP